MMQRNTPGCIILRCMTFLSISINGQILHIWSFWHCVSPWYIKIYKTIDMSKKYIHLIDDWSYLVLQFVTPAQFSEILIDSSLTTRNSIVFLSIQNYFLWRKDSPRMHNFEVDFSSIPIKVKFCIFNILDIDK